MSRRRRRHAQIHLPPMSGAQAYLLAESLERAVAAIWRAHGDAMADFHCRVFPDTPLPPGAPAVEYDFDEDADF